jgi:hypothetical protein
MFHYNGGWRVDQHPRLMADVNNDGRGDVIGFGRPMSTPTGGPT